VGTDVSEKIMLKQRDEIVMRFKSDRITISVFRIEILFQRNSKRRPFTGRLFVLIDGRKVSPRRSGLEAVAPAPSREQQFGQMRVQEHSSPRKKRKDNQAQQGPCFIQ
jgi:hypothetical protein